MLWIPLCWAVCVGEECAYSQAKMRRAQTLWAGEEPGAKEVGQGVWHCALAQLEVEREGREDELGGWIS